MAVFYFKCNCGAEKRIIAHSGKVGYRPLKDGRTWRFDPTHPEAVTIDSSPQVISCETCGEAVHVSDDPEAVDSFMQLNWLEGR